MVTWIFQCNPDHYDIDELLASDTKDILFSANQSASRMLPGDPVYLWRSQGKNGATAGIVAKGRLTETPSDRRDISASSKYWIDAMGAKKVRPRVAMRIDDVANKKEIIQRSWMLEDPILKELTILKMANNSNYAITDAQEQRVSALWENTGVDWTRADTIAALRVYQQTHGGSLSQLPGSPVAEAAILIGRAVKGVYNKVQNFRHIDPRESRAGFSGGGALAREIWEEFYDPATEEIDTDKLEEEFRRLHGSHNAPIELASQESAARIEADYSYKPGPVPQPLDQFIQGKHHEEWHVYVLALNEHETLKVGHSCNPKERLKAYNRAILPEITKLKWKLSFTYKVSDAQTAQNIEQVVLKKFSARQLSSNGEVLHGVKEMDVQLALIEAARNEISAKKDME